MTEAQRPTDSVLRRHFEAANQGGRTTEPPQESTLVRHHEQMRSIWEEDTERDNSFVPHTEPGPGGDASHPLSIHLAMQPAAPARAAARPSAGSRESMQANKMVPPEDSTLKRHFTQLNDVTFAEHPLAIHLRMIAVATSVKGQQAPSSPAADKQPHVASTTESKEETQPANAAANDTGRPVGMQHRQTPPSVEPSGWLSRLLRRIFGG